MKNDELTLLLRSFDEEDLGEIDRLQLDHLLAESAEAQAEHARIGRMRELVAAQSADEFDPFFADRVVRHVAALQERPQRTPSELPWHLDRFVEFVRSWRFATGMAAAAAVAVALAVVTWLVPVDVSVPKGEMRTVALGDGSEVELSGGSSISYLRFWGRSERRVTLEGEAFFDVAEESRPFVVETFNANVTVLGTAFNVRAWRSDPQPQTEVAVATGRVAVEPHRRSVRVVPQESVSPESEALNDAPSDEQVEAGSDSFLGDADALVLEAGQLATVGADSIVAARGASLDRVLAWRTGGLAFVDQPLGSVFTTLERRFGIEVHAASPEIHEQLLTYLNPQPQSPAAVLADICHTLDLRYRRTADGFEVLAAREE